MVSFTTGTNIIAIISSISAILLVSIMGWMIGAQLINIDGKVESLSLPGPKGYDTCFKKYTQEDCSIYYELITEIKNRWNTNQPIFLTCSLVIIAVGFSQIATSLPLLVSGPQKLKRRTRVWMIGDFIFVILTLLCILSPYITRTEYGMGKESWLELLEDLERTVHNMDPSIDISSLTVFLKVSENFFYITLATYICVISSLFFFGIFVLHKYNKYEAQE